MLDKKGIAAYLFITLVVSFVLEAVAIAAPRLSLLAYLVILVPAGAAFVASRLSPGTRPNGVLGDVSFSSAVRIALVVPLAFAVVHFLTTLLGATHPDWRIAETVAQLPTPKDLQLPMPFTPLWPAILLGMGFLVTTVLGPTLYALVFLGTEWGWRGYLLPRLMPLGRWKAYAVSGALWWLSFGPFLIYQRSQPRVLFAVLSLALVIVLSALLGAICHGSRRIGLSAVCCGVFVCQATMAWRVLFPHEDTALPLGSSVGIISIIIWACLAAFPRVLLGKSEN